MSLSIVKAGTWLYGRSIKQSVDVVALNYDWWFQMAQSEGLLESDEEPMAMGPDGCLYYVRFQQAASPLELTWVDSQGFPSVQGAIREAEKKAGGLIQWQD